ncbi:unnamed protein product [Vitrella brassicaformis CCMP3155]|uniref:RING-type domain-containing protein n=2 Tax=Vitrella brassicaformis TaxID=1169539 RepID=A0A0G4F253_VITBC|nr:unnamed protein product [Vitrella brassicaformis CCMP3155]|eukprot:CEM05609.1 unnamed protein product [Vitrella brassicaformis CCMP3155]
MTDADPPSSLTASSDEGTSSSPTSFKMDDRIPPSAFEAQQERQIAPHGHAARGTDALSASAARCADDLIQMFRQHGAAEEVEIAIEAQAIGASSEEMALVWSAYAAVLHRYLTTEQGAAPTVAPEPQYACSPQEGESISSDEGELLTLEQLIESERRLAGHMTVMTLSQAMLRSSLFDIIIQALCGSVGRRLFEGKEGREAPMGDTDGAECAARLLCAMGVGTLDGWRDIVQLMVKGNSQKHHESLVTLVRVLKRDWLSEKLLQRARNITATLNEALKQHTTVQSSRPPPPPPPPPPPRSGNPLLASLSHIHHRLFSQDSSPGVGDRNKPGDRAAIPSLHEFLGESSCGFVAPYRRVGHMLAISLPEGFAFDMAVAGGTLSSGLTSLVSLHKKHLGGLMDLLQRHTHLWRMRLSILESTVCRLRYAHASVDACVKRGQQLLERIEGASSEAQDREDRWREQQKVVNAHRRALSSSLSPLVRAADMHMLPWVMTEAVDGLLSLVWLALKSIHTALCLASSFAHSYAQHHIKEASLSRETDDVLLLGDTAADSEVSVCASCVEGMMASDMCAAVQVAVLGGKRDVGLASSHSGGGERPDGNSVCLCGVYSVPAVGRGKRARADGCGARRCARCGKCASCVPTRTAQRVSAIHQHNQRTLAGFSTLSDVLGSFISASSVALLNEALSFATSLLARRACLLPPSLLPLATALDEQIGSAKRQIHLAQQMARAKDRDARKAADDYQVLTSPLAFYHDALSGGDAGGDASEVLGALHKMHCRRVGRMREVHGRMEKQLRDKTADISTLRQQVSADEGRIAVLQAENAQLQEKASMWVCQVCFERDRDTLFLPCMHFALCSRCAARVADGRNKCPMCNAPIGGKLHCSFV